MHAAVSAAKTIADRVASVEDGARLDRAVTEFADVLSLSCDGGVVFTPSDHEVLGRLANRVIDRIEAHLATDCDRASLQQDLAGTVYRIRRELEEIDRWQRHLHRAAGPVSGRAS